MRRCVAAWFVFIAASAAPAQSRLPTLPVVLTGQPAWGGTPGVFFSLQPPVITNSGMLAFHGRTGLDPSTDLEGLFLWHSGQGQQIAREGDPLANHPVFTYRSLASPRIDETGRVAFWADTTGFLNDSALVSGAPGALEIVAIAGSDPNPAPSYINVPAPGSALLLTRNGSLGFGAGSLATRAFWTRVDGSLSPIISSIEPAPGYAAGVYAANLLVSRMSESGVAAVLGQLTGGGFSGERIAFTASQQGRAVIAGPGLPAPQTTGVFVSGGGAPSINRSGLVGFSANFLEDATTPQRGAWVGTPGNFQLIARSGTQPPGFPSGSQFLWFDTPHVTASGCAVMKADASYGSGFRSGLWRWSGSELSLVVTTGTPVHGLPAGTQVLALDGFTSSNRTFAINDGGQVAAFTHLTVPGQPNPAISLIAEDAAGVFHAIATAGFPFEVAPGDTRTVSYVAVPRPHYQGTYDVHTGNDGVATFFNASGQLAFQLRFTDGTSGVFVVTVPEPAAAMAIVLAIASRRRRRPA